MNTLEYKDIESVSWYKFKRTPTFNISWHMTDCCNYNCSYCFDKKKQNEALSKLKEKGLTTDIDKEQLLKTANYINDLVENASFKKEVDTIHYTLIGGEVSLLGDLLFDIINILSSNKNYNYTFNITTNLSYSYEYYKNLIDIAASNKQITKFVILGSYHFEHTSKENFSNKIIRLKQYVDNNHFDNITLRTSMVIRTDNFEEIKWLSEKLEGANIYQSVRRQLKEDKSAISYPAEITDWINSHDREYLRVGVKTVTGEYKEYPLNYIKELLLSNDNFNTNGKICLSNALQIRGDELRDTPCQSRNLIGHIGDKIDLGSLFYKRRICNLKSGKNCSFCSNFEFNINKIKLEQDKITNVNDGVKNRYLIFRLDQKNNNIFNEEEIVNIIKNYPTINVDVFGKLKIVFKLRSSQFNNFTEVFESIKEKFKEYDYLDFRSINFEVDNIDEAFLNNLLKYNNMFYRFYITYDSNFDYKIDKLKDLKYKKTIYVNNADEFVKVSNLKLQNVVIYPVIDSMDKANIELVHNTKTEFIYDGNKLSLPYYCMDDYFHNYGYYINCNRRTSVFYDKEKPYVRVGSCCCNEINSFTLEDFLLLEKTEKYKEYINNPYVFCTNKEALAKHIVYDNTCIKKEYMDKELETNLTPSFLKEED